jgi:hypothetical protein
LTDSLRENTARARTAREAGNKAEAERLLAHGDSIQLRAKNALTLLDRVSKPSETAPAAPLAARPCDGPRPYRNWSNEELNIAQVKYMGKPESPELIREAGCRTAGR